MAKNQTDSIAKQIHMKLEKMMDALLKSNMEWRPELYKKYGEDGETPNSDTIAAIEVVESEDKRAVSELKASPTSSASQDLTRVMTVVERYIEETASAYSDVAR